jgi:hypothetical protein
MAKDSSPPKISIVIPAVRPVSESSILRSYHQAKFKQYQVQFIFLVNSREPSRLRASESETEGLHEILTIYNDRYFGSCEENIARIGDFIDLLGDFIVIVGEHDLIDWPVLAEAAGTFFRRSLDAMAINIKNSQERADGSYASLDAIAPVDIKNSGYDYVQVLFSRQVLSSEVAFPALISCYGPIDWAAYVGSHAFTKEVFRRILMFKFSEDVYSLVYKQLRFFVSRQCKYAYFSVPFVNRVSNDFLRMAENRFSSGWLEDHRRVKGLSPYFWIANLQYLIEIQDSALFCLVAFSHCLSCVPSGDGAITRVHQSFFRLALWWSADVLNYKLSGKSHYLPDVVGSCDLGDLYTVYAFLEKLTAIIAADIKLTKLLGESNLFKLERSARHLASYVKGLSDSPQLIHMARNEIEAVRFSVNSQELVSLCDASFHCYMVSLGMKKRISARLGTRQTFGVLSRSLIRKWPYSGVVKKLIFDVKCRLKSLLLPFS